MKGGKDRRLHLILCVFFLANLLVNVPQFRTNLAQASPETTFSVQPLSEIDPSLTSGSGFTVNVTISDAVDIYSWQVYMEWDTAVLNVTAIGIAGFLADQPEGSIPASRINNDDGFLIAGETTSGQYPGKDATFALLCNVTFLVLSYGSSILDISGGTYDLTYYQKFIDYPTKHYPITENGYFRNLGPGDANGDGIVDIFDIGAISAHWYPGPPIGPLGYGKEADINYDGSVDIFDIGITSANWGNTYP